MLRDYGIDYAGWLPNYQAPEAFGRFSMTVHIPRRPYAESLPGIPTIRMFEALACGIPLVSAPWNDIDQLFTPGCEYLVARDGAAMKRQMKLLLDNADLRAQLAASGLDAIATRHSCAHRVDELLAIRHEIDTAVTGQQIHPSARLNEMQSLEIAFFGSSLISACWNGGATYYRGLRSRCVPA